MLPLATPNSTRPIRPPLRLLRTSYSPSAIGRHDGSPTGATSNHPDVAAHRDLIHKIGVTGGSVEARTAQAATDATYLLADGEIIATYKLFNINRVKLENLIHRVFASARLDLTIHDRFGHPVQPREWYLVPLSVIDEVVDKIRDGSVTGFEYDPSRASLIDTK
jgi:hypothetical protein